MIQVVFFVFISGVVIARSFDPYQIPLGSSVWGYFTPPMLKRPPPIQTPMEAMVDLTNSLGVAILQDHSYSRGNFAFSPYGVASVLVVMYEGARGESASQIHRAVGFPSDRDVLRMGFRDIHRHLRSYFSHEGFLSGISLNKNGSSLTPEFKKLLKYYGYDVDLNFQLDDDSNAGQNNKPSAANTDPTKSTVTSTSEPSTQKSSATTERVNEEMDKGNTTADPKVKEEPTVTDKGSAEEGNDEPTSTMMTTVNETIPTTEKASTGGESEADESTGANLKEEDVPTTTEGTSADERITDQTTVVGSEPATESHTEEPTTYETVKVNKNTEPATEMIQSTTDFAEDVKKLPEILKPHDNKENKFQKSLEFNEKERKCRKEVGREEGGPGNEILCEPEQKEGDPTEPETKASEGEGESEGVKLDNGMLIPPSGEEPTTGAVNLEKTTSESTFLHFGKEAVDSSKRSMEEISLEESSSRKSLAETDKTRTRRVLKPNRDGWEKKLRKMFDSKSSAWAHEPPKKRRRFNAGRVRRTIADYLKWPLNPDLSLQLQNGMYDSHVSRNAEMYRSLPRLMFLVDGAVDTPVPMMTFTNVFAYGYIAKLHAKALEFPLDDVRYKLLIVLPMERRGLRQLIYDLADFSVRDVLKCMRPTRVKAMIPTFMVEGFVILTSSLQKLGIWDVFDPRKANLSGMSVDPELYVRNVEQSVTVVIRNYVEILDIQTRTMAARYLEHEFQATHPFVYFVLDTSTNVALMAGQMLDPLNSRIY